MLHAHAGFWFKGINIRTHAEILLATPRGQQGNEVGYRAMPRIAVRKGRIRRYGTAWPIRYSPKRTEVCLILYDHARLDGFDAIETLCHEMAHLLAPLRSGHDQAWRSVYRKLALQAYQVDVGQPGRYHGCLAPILREKAKAGVLGL